MSYIRRRTGGLTAGAIQHLENWRYKMAEITMFPVQSSNLQSVGYDAEERVLAVRFLEKRTSPSTLYWYYDVEPQVFEDLMSAPSKGIYHNLNIKWVYNYDRIE